MTDRSCPPEHGTDIALLHERTKQNAENIKELDITLNERLKRLEKTVADGFSSLEQTLREHAINDARRTGAEKLGAWLIGTLAALGTIAATVWAAVHSSAHH